MTDPINDIQMRVNRLREGLRQSGVRLTHQRLEICREIASADNHPDAETVYMEVRKRVPTISLDTVYRTLWTLRNLGLIDTLGIPHERIRFDGNTTPHHHFVCTRCGETHDFYSCDFNRLAIPEEVAAIGSVEKAQVEIRGICLKCSKTSDLPDNEHDQRSE
jgi:Fur family peroxide stress response transcriptional regulator